MWFANTLLWNASVNSTAPVCPLAVSVTTNVSLAVVLDPTYVSPFVRCPSELIKDDNVVSAVDSFTSVLPNWPPGTSTVSPVEAPFTVV
jgi:hypothetical protein